MMTVMDVLRGLPESARAAMVQRHGDYVSGHVVARLADEGYEDPELEAMARNLAGIEHSSTWTLTSAAVDLCHKQAAALSGAGIIPVCIYGSEQGRGTHTGVALSEGFYLERVLWVPFETHRALNFPTYDYEVAKWALRPGGVGDQMVALWLNGDLSNLVLNESPLSFKGRVMGFLASLFSSVGNGLTICATHFEIVTLVHALCVDGTPLGEIDLNWMPKKGGGVLLYHDAIGGLWAVEYTPELEIVDRPVQVQDDAFTLW